MIRIGKIFEEADSNLKLKFRGWEQDIPHEGEKGGLRERRVADFLSFILPKRYGIATGHIVDNKGETSKQSDIVIYDALDGIILPIDDYYSLIPCESVYAVVEVKSTLTASNGPDGTIFECLKNTQTLRSLNRTNEYHSLAPIANIVFAYQVNSGWKEKPELQVIRWFDRLGKQINTSFPDLIFVLDPGFLIYQLNDGDHSNSEADLAIFNWSPLLQFTSQLIRCLSQTKTETPNLWFEYDYLNLTEDRFVGEIVKISDIRKKHRRNS